MKWEKRNDYEREKVVICNFIFYKPSSQEYILIYHFLTHNVTININVLCLFMQKLDLIQYE